MAEIILTILQPLLGKLGEYLVNPIMNQVSYLCCYSCNVERLNNEVRELNTVRESVQQDVDAAKDNLGVIRAEVDLWLSKADELQRKSTRIRNDAAEVQKSCLSKWCPILHYRLSREALKTTEASIKLRDDRRFDKIANPVNPADLPPIPTTSVIGFESRDSIEDEIMDALKDDSVYLIGICGMGGVGKTTMAKKIEKRVREKTEDSVSLFEKVIMVVVSQQLDLPKIQQQIAEELRLDLKQESVTIRAKLLHARLTSAKSILIILDDVWEPLDLEELGIPSQSTNAGCKLILTSRNRNAFTEDANIFSLGVLNDEESWILFRRSAGNSIDSSDLHEIAKDVVKECNGLPLALVTVGRALRGLSKSSWEDALIGLQRSIPTNILTISESVYRPLLWSYNQLESEECRYLFLLCCLFPEDSEIPLEALVIYGKGLGIFYGVENLREAKIRAERIIEHIINRSLLMEVRIYGTGNLYVTMHDVIRDMGISIAREGKHVFMISHGRNEWPEPQEDSYGDYTCISLIFSKGNISIPKCIKCSSLELLRVDFPEASQVLPQNFFSGMTRLKVLEVSGIKSLPSSINLLNNLRTLCLRKRKLKMISIIGELINLEILSLIDSNFEVLPEEIGGLRKLRKLEIIECRDLRSIAYGVLSGLVQLEELVIRRSFRNWEVEEKGKEMKNASLAELHSLSYLTTLHIEISDPNAIPKKMPLGQKLTNYTISVGEVRGWASRYQKAIELGYKDVTPLEDWLYDMVGDAECLVLEAPICRNVVDRLVGSEYQNLKAFGLCKCSDVQFLIYPFAAGQQNRAFFPILKELNIEDSCSLQEIYNGSPPAGSFEALEEITLKWLSGLMHLWTFTGEKLRLSSLKVVKITDCGSLLYIFPLSIAESLSQLERLEVSYCRVMKEIFKKEEGEVEITINEIKFPKLWYLSLKNLPSLCGFCNGIDRIEAPALRKFFIADLPRTTKEGNHDVHQQLLFDQQVAGNSFELYIFTPLCILSNLSRLQTLEVKSIHNFKGLFSPSLLSGLTNLKKLTIEDCSTLEEVIGKEEMVREAKTKRTLFPQLTRLELSRLPKILAFCHNMGDIELPSLEELHIEDCPMMETFVKGISKHAIQSFFSKEVFCTKLKTLKLEKLNTAGIFCHNIPVDNFCGLEILTIRSCHKMSNLFSPVIFRGLTNLRLLDLEDCEELQEVIAKEDDQEGTTNIKETLSPRLFWLRLRRLPKMQRFCHINNDLEFPSLQYETIRDCPMLEIFSLGPLHLPRFKYLYGLEDHDFAAKLFLKKEKSSDEIHSENNCFTLSPRDLSITMDKEGRLEWAFARDSSDSFVTAAEVQAFSGSLEIRGKFEIVKLLPGIAYEILFMVMLDEDESGWEEAVDVQLTLPGGIEQHRTEILDEKRRGEWIEMLVAEFTREPHQIGQLEFSLSAKGGRIWWLDLGIKGVRIRVKG